MSGELLVLSGAESVGRVRGVCLQGQIKVGARVFLRGLLAISVLLEMIEKRHMKRDVLDRLMISSMLR